MLPAPHCARCSAPVNPRSSSNTLASSIIIGQHRLKRALSPQQPVAAAGLGIETNAIARWQCTVAAAPAVAPSANLLRRPPEVGGSSFSFLTPRSSRCTPPPAAAAIIRSFIHPSISLSKPRCDGASVASPLARPASVISTRFGLFPSSGGGGGCSEREDQSEQQQQRPIGEKAAKLKPKVNQFAGQQSQRLANSVNRAKAQCELCQPQPPLCCGFNFGATALSISPARSVGRRYFAFFQLAFFALERNAAAAAAIFCSSSCRLPVFLSFSLVVLLLFLLPFVQWLESTH